MTSTGEFPVSFVPRSVSDSIDGDNSPAGACASLSNLLFDPSTPGVLACRPAVQQLSIFGPLNNPTVVSVASILNGVIYGLIASSLYPSKDQPFAYNLISGVFLPVSGITSSNCPNTLSTNGDWIPPQAAVLGPRTLIVHSGFNFGAGYAFGYFDTSSYNAVLTGNITNGSPTITGNPFIGALGPGYPLSGAGIPAGATVQNVSNIAVTTTGSLTSASSVITGVPAGSTAVGQQVAGEGIATGATVVSISGTSVTISSPASVTQANETIYFTGTTITMSANATATTNNLSITATGGTATNPLWAAGNTMLNPLVAQPTTVAQYSNRFYFGAAQALSWSDTLALTMTASDQTLFIGDASSITALSPMSLVTTTQAIIDALIIFKSNYITQLTGDAATSNLQTNAISVDIGTSSPRSIAILPQGLKFQAVDGIRMISLQGILSDPDPDLALPFIYTLYPSRSSGGFNNNTYRICVQNNNAAGAPYQEYWYDVKRQGWTGPHTFRQDLALAYKSTFILFSNTFAPSIWQSDVVPGANDSYSEVGTTDYTAEDGVTLYTAEDGVTEYSTEDTGVVNFYTAEDGETLYVTEDGTQDYVAEGITGNTLEFLYQIVPMTDFKNVYANELLNATLDMAMPSNGNSYLFGAYNEIYSPITQAVITSPPATAIWGAFLWGISTWGATSFGLQPNTIPWPIPIVFNRLSLAVSGNSSAGLKLSRFNMIAKMLKYLLH